jgi:hypothetical protein
MGGDSDEPRLGLDCPPVADSNHPTPARFWGPGLTSTDRGGTVSDDYDIDWMQDELRRDLGLRPETRLDCVIFRDGSAYELQADNTLLQVRQP